MMKQKNVQVSVQIAESLISSIFGDCYFGLFHVFRKFYFHVFFKLLMSVCHMSLQSGSKEANRCRLKREGIFPCFPFFPPEKFDVTVEVKKGLSNLLL